MSRWLSRETLLCLVCGLLVSASLQSAELMLPQGRQAYFADEAIELAIFGLKSGESAVVELVPLKPGATAVRFNAKGDGSTVVYVAPARSLAPNEYAVKLDGKEAAKIKVSAGAYRSPMLLAQTSMPAPQGGANASVGNAFSFGLTDPHGQPLLDVRGKRSQGMNAFEMAVRDDIPILMYMYWTGYVLHKPFGDQKSWANAEMNEAMRLLSFSVAQRLRRFGRAVATVGPIDEPGLGWGKTPAGGTASGFPDWDEAPWYEARNWKYTADIANQTDDNWLNYMRIRCEILGENYSQAKRDWKAVWPQVVWSGDLYAPHAIMDGTEPLNQRVNDVPASHVFFDFFGGPMATTGQIYLEKAHHPTVKLAHAMNGQLWGVAGPQRPLYHWLMNGMLAAGLNSNWWLNTGAMTKEDLAAVNEPAERLGPLFHQLTPQADVALLWSFTELAMRQKDMATRESKKKTGEQIKLLLPFPDEKELGKQEIESNAYEIGGAYTTALLDVHQTIRRAGYPVHFVHESILPGGILRNYKVLVIAEQTYDLPPEVRSALGEYLDFGGKIITLPSTTQKFDKAILADVKLSASAVRAATIKRERAAKAAKTKRDKSIVESNWVANERHRLAVAPMKQALQKLQIRPVFVSDHVSLSAERHIAGAAQLLMVLNGHEQIPNGPNATEVPRYNPAATNAKFTLPSIPPGSVVYRVSGLDWKKVELIADPTAEQSAPMAAGEMLLYYVVPQAPAGLEIRDAHVLAPPKGEVNGGMNGSVLWLTVGAKGLQAPCPFVLTVTDDGRTLYRLLRATDATGMHKEVLQIGNNANLKSLSVNVESSLWPATATANVEYAPAAIRIKTLSDSVRVFDEPALRQFAKQQPAVVVGYGTAEQKPAADDLATRLGAAGWKATARQANEVIRKVAYPRVWNPYARVYKATGPVKQPSGAVKQAITLATDDAGVVSAKSSDGKESADWRTPLTKVVVAGVGYLDWIANNETVYEPGCELYVDQNNQIVVLKGEFTEAKTTPEFRAKWAKPWRRLMEHVGGFQLPPELPEAYTTDSHLILLGDSTTNPVIAALQASEILPQVTDAKYPGPSKALVMFAWSPFAVEKNVVVIGACDAAGLSAGAQRLVGLAAK